MKTTPLALAIVVLTMATMAGMGLTMLVSPNLGWKIMRRFHRMQGGPANSDMSAKIERMLAESRKARLSLRITGAVYLLVIGLLCALIFRR